MEIEYKDVRLCGFKSLAQEEGDGIIKAIVSVTGVEDNVGDTITPGAYKKTLMERTPKGVWHHSWTTPVSKTLDVKELMPGDLGLPGTLPNGSPCPSEAGALQVKMQFNLDTQRGREAYSDVVFFADDQEWSVGFNVPPGKGIRNKATGKRQIKEMQLFEYSPVLFGAMPSSRTVNGGVKQAQMMYKALVALDEGESDTLFDDDIEQAEDETEYDVLDREEVIDSAFKMLDMAGYFETKELADSVDDLKSFLPDDLFTKVEQLSSEFDSAVNDGDVEHAQDVGNEIVDAVEQVFTDSDDEETQQAISDFADQLASQYQTIDTGEYEGDGNDEDAGAGDEEEPGDDEQDDESDDDDEADEEDDSEPTSFADTLSYAELSDDVNEALQPLAEKFDKATNGTNEKAVDAAAKALVSGIKDQMGGDDDTALRRLASSVADEVESWRSANAADDAKPVKRTAKKSLVSDDGSFSYEVKRTFSTEQLASLGKKGMAFKNANGDWSFPIENKSDLENAISAFGRNKAEDADKLKSYIKKRAHDLGADGMIPDGWNGGSEEKSLTWDELKTLADGGVLETK